jgi:hypothetical protein
VAAAWRGFGDLPIPDDFSTPQAHNQGRTQEHIGENFINTLFYTRWTFSKIFANSIDSREHPNQKSAHFQ